ncbi:hypothetical protein ACH5RR_018596 [Cinchona calisaya]|uniref:Uncharacterized protein n=1 Tax=Cinchona calisaya TaxID=153742 RepID=A0ABD2ZPQ7_9GENT
MEDRELEEDGGDGLKVWGWETGLGWWIGGNGGSRVGGIEDDSGIGGEGSRQVVGRGKKVTEKGWSARKMVRIGGGLGKGVERSWIWEWWAGQGWGKRKEWPEKEWWARDRWWQERGCEGGEKWMG